MIVQHPKKDMDTPATYEKPMILAYGIFAAILLFMILASFLDLFTPSSCENVCLMRSDIKTSLQLRACLDACPRR